MSKCGVISGPYFPLFGLNTGKYGPEITPYLDIFHAVQNKEFVIISSGLRNNTLKRKNLEALCIKDLQPTLNRQDKSEELKLFS